MSAHFTCPKCGKRLRIAEGARGKQGLCPSCRHLISIPPELPQGTIEARANKKPGDSPESRTDSVQPPAQAKSCGAKKQDAAISSTVNGGTAASLLASCWRQYRWLVLSASLAGFAICVVAFLLGWIAHTGREVAPQPSPVTAQSASKQTAKVDADGTLAVPTVAATHPQTKGDSHAKSDPAASSTKAEPVRQPSHATELPPTPPDNVSKDLALPDLIERIEASVVHIRSQHRHKAPAAASFWTSKETSLQISML